MTRTRSFRPQAAAHRSPHGAWRRAAMGGTAATLALALVACAAPGAPSGTSSAGSGSASTQASSQKKASEQPTTPVHGALLDRSLDPGPDVTAKALRASQHVASVSATVQSWASPCAATSVVETFLWAAQSAIANDQRKAARGLVRLAAAVMAKREKQGLVSPARSRWFAAQVSALLGELPLAGHVVSVTGFPKAAAVLRCAGQSSSAAPKAPSEALLLAAASGADVNVPSVSDAVREGMTTGLVLGAEAIVGELNPVVAAGEVVAAIVGLLWPSPEPDYVTWDDMTTYVNTQIDQAVVKIEDLIETQRLTDMQNELTALGQNMRDYETNMSRLQPSTTELGGLTASSRDRAEGYRSAIQTDFNNMLPVFTVGPTAYKNLPESIFLYSLYIVTLRSWYFDAAKFQQTADQVAPFQAQIESKLTAAIAAATSLVSTQYPSLQAEEKPTGPSPQGKGWDMKWSFLDRLYKDGYDQVPLWKYMDPVAFPPDAKGLVVVQPDTTVVATPCLGETAVKADPWNGTDPMVARNIDPSDKLTPGLTDKNGAAGPPLQNINVWSSNGEVMALQANYTGQPLGPLQGWFFVGGTPPTVVTNGDADGWITSVNGSYVPSYLGISVGQVANTDPVYFGGHVHVQFTKTLVGSDGKVTKTTESDMIPAGGSVTPFDISFPGYVLAWVGFPDVEVAPDLIWSRGRSDTCMAFGFRLLDSYPTK